MIVDDEEPVRRVFMSVLQDDGYECLPFSQGLDALLYLSTCTRKPDLILSDIRMPGMSGIELLCALRKASCGIPLILVSGGYELPEALKAIGNGAADYLLKPVRMQDLLEVVSKNIPSRQPRDRERALCEAAFLKDLFNVSLQALSPELNTLLHALSQKRIETLQHSCRVAAYSVLVGQRMGMVLGTSQLSELRLGAMLHDIGKVIVPENVIQKAGPLTSEERRVMELHPAIGRELLLPLPNMLGVAEIVYSHHERHDGRGYPRRIADENIPLGARIFSVVDTFDAITSDRPYRKARPIEVARAEISQLRGSQFDPLVVKAFMKVSDAELECIMHHQGDLVLA